MIYINYYLSKKWGLETTVDSDGDSFYDNVEEASSSEPTNESSLPSVDFSQTVEGIITPSIDLNSVELNLMLWLDASNIDSVGNTTIANGDGIDRWSDLSGKGNNIFQSSGTYQPIFNSSINSIDFDGTDDFLSGGDILDVNTATGWTIFVVGKGEIGTYISKSFSSDLDNRYAILSEVANQNLYVWDDTNGSFNTSTSIINQTSIMNLSADRVNQTVSAYQDGTFISSAAISESNSYTMNSISNFLVGAHNDNTGTGTLAGYYLNGNIQEIIIVNKVLSDDEKNNINYYLSKKWGIEEFVDSDGDGFLDNLEESINTSP